MTARPRNSSPRAIKIKSNCSLPSVSSHGGLRFTKALWYLLPEQTQVLPMSWALSEAHRHLSTCSLILGCESEVAQSCATLCDPMEPARLLGPWNFPGKSTGVDYHLLLQRIFPTQGLNPGLPHCRQTLYRLSHPGSPWLGEVCLCPP